ncbi:MAG: hypothetical protein L3J26_07715 [Candidatus Polarisedimenticolaceae bacterium]|nr:hypothetical protein [Candidatus Polarisedimenticolaceae bacterium]
MQKQTQRVHQLICGGCADIVLGIFMQIKFKEIPMRTKSFAGMVVMLSVTGCAIGPTSQVPIATTYEYTTQQKMQAAHHWDVLAEDVALRLKEHINELSVAGRTINVISDNNSPFHDAFEDLLITQMVNQGLDIRDNNHGALKLKFNTQVIRHSDRGYIREKAGLFTTAALVGTGVWAAINVVNGKRDAGIAGALIGSGVIADLFTGDIATISNKEVIINVSLMDGDKYIMRKTGIYYINEPDDSHYTKQYIPVSSEIPVVSEWE